MTPRLIKMRINIIVFVTDMLRIFWYFNCRKVISSQTCFPKRLCFSLLLDRSRLEVIDFSRDLLCSSVFTLLSSNDRLSSEIGCELSVIGWDLSFWLSSDSAAESVFNGLLSSTVEHDEGAQDERRFRRRKCRSGLTDAVVSTIPSWSNFLLVVTGEIVSNVLLEQKNHMYNAINWNAMHTFQCVQELLVELYHSVWFLFLVLLVLDSKVKVNEVSSYL